MKYFILRGYRPQPVRNNSSIGVLTIKNRSDRIAMWRKFYNELPIEGERCLLRIPGVGRLSAFVYDVYNSLILIAAQDQEAAYSIASPFRAYCVIYLGYYPIDEELEYLFELSDKPNPKATSSDVASLYHNVWVNPISEWDIELALETGYVMFDEQIEYACLFVKSIHSQGRFSQSLMHLVRSQQIFAGYMSGSYYHFHYSRDRAVESEYAKRKKYLEEKTRYDLALLSAFRAIEAILDAPSLKKPQVEKKLAELDQLCSTSFSIEKYRSFFEIFSGGPEERSYSDIISYYLDIRNSVAAHANPKPPFSLSEDQVLEIQNLALVLLGKSLDCIKEGDT